MVRMEFAMFTLSSSAFAENQPIPKEYTGDGADTSPPLEWTTPPEGTVSFALICDDPDAPKRTWVHWVLFNIPGSQRTLDAAIPTDGELPNGSLQGTTDFGFLGYGGPAPPPGKPHRYFFKLYALDALLTLPVGATKADLLNAMKNHIVAETTLMGTYQR